MKNINLDIDELEGNNYFERFSSFFKRVFKYLDQTNNFTMLVSPEISVIFNYALSSKKISIPENIIVKDDVDIPSQILCIPIFDLDQAVSFSVVNI